MQQFSARKTMLAVSAAAIALPGCTNYVKLDDYNATISEIHATDQRMQSQIAALSQKYDTLATEVAGRIEVQSAAHFATGDSTLSEQDKPFQRMRETPARSRFHLRIRRVGAAVEVLSGCTNGQPNRPA